MMPPKLITLNNVEKSYKLASGETRLILNDINLSWRINERIGLLGPNGIGKTTLLRLIGGLESPDRGEIKYPDRRRMLPIVFQRPEDHFVFETVKRQITSHARRRIPLEDFFEFATRLGLPKALLLEPPLSLSTGQQRLVAICSGVIKNAGTLILDEPFAGLDSVGRDTVSQGLKNINPDMGFIIVSHHPDDLIDLVERVWIMDDQRIVFDGAFYDIPDHLLQKHFAPTDPAFYLFLRRLENLGILIRSEEVSRKSISGWIKEIEITLRK